MVEHFEELKALKAYAKEHRIPIMQEDGINYLTTFLLKHKCRRILELGTAIGYSAIRMALTNDEITVTTVERDEERYLEAVKNVKRFGLEDRIMLIYHDALTLELEGTYDLIFLDAAKAQNIRFFEKYASNLAEDGYIITDNLSFHGLVETPIEEIESHNVRGLVRKTKEYITYLQENEAYETQFLTVGDGISITHRKEKSSVE